MSIISILFALLLSGSANFGISTNSIIGGGPVGAAPTSSTPGGTATVDGYIGGGPVTAAPNPSATSGTATVDGYIGGGPVT